jgi:hypothetical protein
MSESRFLQKIHFRRLVQFASYYIKEEKTTVNEAAEVEEGTEVAEAAEVVVEGPKENSSKTIKRFKSGRNGSQ